MGVTTTTNLIGTCQPDAHRIRLECPELFGRLAALPPLPADYRDLTSPRNTRRTRGRRTALISVCASHEMCPIIARRAPRPSFAAMRCIIARCSFIDRSACGRRPKRTCPQPTQGDADCGLVRRPTAMGGRLDLHLDRRGLAVCGGGARPVLAPRGRLVVVSKTRLRYDERGMTAELVTDALVAISATCGARATSKSVQRRWRRSSAWPARSDYRSRGSIARDGGTRRSAIVQPDAVRTRARLA